MNSFEKEEFYSKFDSIENGILAIADTLKIKHADTKHEIRTSTNEALNTDMLFKRMNDAIANLNAIKDVLGKK